MSAAGAFLLALLVATVATPLLARAARAVGWVDAPTLERKRQRAPVPPVGGAAVLLGWGAALPFTGFAAPFGLRAELLLASVVLVFLVGTLDDLRARGLGPAAKLGLQTLALGPLALAAAQRFESPLVAAALALGCGLAALNLANTFDHADGALASVALVGLALGAWPLGGGAGAAAAGATAGFLPWNLDGARRRSGAPSAYLGDAGSHVLGLLLLLHPAAWGAFLLPALDLARLSVARLRAGSRPWIGDRRHVSHVLERAGRGTRAVAALLALAAAPAVLGARLGAAPAPGAPSRVWVALGVAGTLGLWLGLLRRGAGTARTPS